MPVRKDDPIQEVRKKAMKGPEQDTKSKKAKSVPSVIPSEEFSYQYLRALELCKALIKAKKSIGKGKDLGGSYKKNAAALSDVVTRIVATLKATASNVTSALAKMDTVLNAKLPVQAHKDAVAVLNQLNGSHREIKDLNQAVGDEIKKSRRGLAPATIMSYLKRIRPVYENAEQARKQADTLYWSWSKHINPGSRAEQRSGLRKGPGIVPKFVVNNKVVEVGESKTVAGKKAATKIKNALNLGAIPFPDPYTVLWEYYSAKNKSLKLDDNVRACIRYIVLFCATQSKQPEQNTVVELFNDGNLFGDGDKFDGTKFNENFNNVLAYLVKAVKKNQKLKDFVFTLNQRADDSVYEMALNHLERRNSRGYSLLDNARKQYLDRCRDWFATYLPKL